MHVLSVTGIALGHHTRRFEDRVRDLGHREHLVVRLLGRDDGCVRGEHEVDTRVGHQVGLELSDIHVESSIETKRGRQRGDHLSDQTIEVGVGRALNVEVATAYIVQCLIVKAESAVGVLEEGVRRKHRVVGLNNGRRHLGRRRDGKREL